LGESSIGIGVQGSSSNGYGVYGTSQQRAGVRGHSIDDVGVIGTCGDVLGLPGPTVPNLDNRAGVFGTSDARNGVIGTSTSGVGVVGLSANYVGIVVSLKVPDRKGSFDDVVLGYDSTLRVSLDMMIHHTRADSQGVKRALIVADMPFLTYQLSVEEAPASGSTRHPCFNLLSWGIAQLMKRGKLVPALTAQFRNSFKQASFPRKRARAIGLLNGADLLQ
jgi:hypothetical protein